MRPTRPHPIGGCRGRGTLVGPCQAAPKGCGVSTSVRQPAAFPRAISRAAGYRPSGHAHSTCIKTIAHRGSPAAPEGHARHAGCYYGWWPCGPYGNTCIQEPLRHHQGPLAPRRCPRTLRIGGFGSQRLTRNSIGPMASKEWHAMSLDIPVAGVYKCTIKACALTRHLCVPKKGAG